jgi:hypothetical protein
MPLAQNYKDDVSLLESEAALAKTKLNIITTQFPAYEENHTKTDVSANFYFSIIEAH